MGIMNAVQLKTDLHNLIDKADDLNILQAVKIILAKESRTQIDWAETISISLKEELEASIEEADQGKNISHEEAMRQIKNRYDL
jgi:hypothetical protein